MLQVFHPNRADCDRLAEVMGNGVTGNALRQRIAKLRNKNPIGSGSVATTPTSTTKKGGKNKKAANTGIDDDDDNDEYAAKTPSKKGRAPARARGGGRKRGRSGDDEGDAEELKGTSLSAAKKAKTMGKVIKQEQVPEAKEEDELKIEHEELAGDAGDVGVVAANTIMGGMAFGALGDDEAEPLLGQGSFFYLQDEDEEAV